MIFKVKEENSNGSYTWTTDFYYKRTELYSGEFMAKLWHKNQL
jgi:hypothetical protein